jgi:peptidoglycan/xylan/chitin deacetylase (PgdA/CDA1 family)
MILLFHHVSPPEVVPQTWKSSEGWEFTHSPQGFEHLLVELRHRGYQFVSLDSLVNDIRQRGVENDRNVAITFDDGWVDNYWYALPVLKRHTTTATFFVTSAQMCKGTSEEKRMSGDQLKELLDEGMTIGGHSRTHPNLTQLPPEQAREEIAGCKEDLERALGSPVQWFAYPGGAFNRNVARLTEEAGYKGACSVIGPSRNDKSTLFWLYRDLLSESMQTWHDRYRLSPWARRLFSFRVRRRLHRQLVHGI